MEAIHIRKIMVVDDEKKIRSLYRKLLAPENFEVIEAENSRVAVHLLIREPNVSLVLLDINMPQIDGGVLYDVIRRLDGGIKVIVTSAYSLEDQKKRVHEADGYYDKSQSIDVLLEKIRRSDPHHRA